jgi:DMSO/TMAO reductase YedYZ molybdopterin-dependent catalytic subunit
VYESSTVGANAEMRWEVMKDKGYLVPTENFYIRDHTSTPLIDARTWQLKVFGSGLRGSPTIDNAVTFSYEDLLRMPSTSVISFIECAGNGREFFWLQQDEAVTSVPWLLGGIGVAEWRGVRLADILDRAGLTPDAIDVMPQGLDPDYVTGGVDYGQVGQIEVSATPLFSWWNTLGYRLFGPAYPAEGSRAPGSCGTSPGSRLGRARTRSAPAPPTSPAPPSP